MKQNGYDKNLQQRLLCAVLVFIMMVVCTTNSGIEARAVGVWDF